MSDQQRRHLKSKIATAPSFMVVYHQSQAVPALTLYTDPTPTRLPFTNPIPTYPCVPSQSAIRAIYNNIFVIDEL